MEEQTKRMGTTMESESSLTEQKSTVQQKKLNVFDFVDMVMARFAIVNIEGTLHWYNPDKACYRPINRKDLEGAIINEFYSVIKNTGSMQIVKKSVDIIMCLKLPENLSAEKNMLMAVGNGFIDLRAIEYLDFNECARSAKMGLFKNRIDVCVNSGYVHNWIDALHQSTPIMDKFLESITKGESEIIERIWEMIGYLISPDTDGKCFFVLQGVPNSGKSVLGNLIKSFFLNDNVSSLDIDQLGKRTATSVLVDKFINISMDLPNKPLSPLAIRNIKLITGKDELTVEDRTGRYSKYEGYCKFLFATNHPLRLKGEDEGFLSRIVCIPFTVSIPVEMQDWHLLDTLLTEKEKIMIKALAHYKALRFKNYVFAGSGLTICKPKVEYMPIGAEDTDIHICEFIENRCIFVKLDECREYTYDLYNEYIDFCKQMKYTPISNEQAFSRKIAALYNSKVEKGKWRTPDGRNLNGFKGIAIMMDGDDIHYCEGCETPCSKEKCSECGKCTGCKGDNGRFDWAARYGYKDQPLEILNHAKKNTNYTRYSCINLQNVSTIEFRIFRGTLKYNTLIATLQLVDRICDVAILMSDEEIKELSWTSFVASCTQPELVQYLKERQLYVNEPIAVEEDM